MNKKLIITTLLIITNFITVYSSGPLDNKDSTTIKTLDDMQQGYASKNTQELKSQFISQILGQDDITLEQKITNLENLKKIINADIYLHSGWLWNESTDQTQINWLHEKRSIIDRELKNLKWKASSFGYQVTVQAATMASYYFMAVLLAYLAQDQYSQITGEQTNYSFGQIAAMPITKIIELASSASIATINTITSPTTQNMLEKIYASIVAAGAVGYDYLADTIDAIGTTVPTAAQKGIGDVAQLISNKINPIESKDTTTQTDLEVKTPSNSWIPPIITNTIKQTNNYFEQKNTIQKLEKNVVKNKKLIEQTMAIEKNKAIAAAIQKNESTDPSRNERLKAELEAINFKSKQQQAQLDLQALQLIEHIKKESGKNL